MTAATVAAGLELSDAARAALAPDLSAEAGFDALVRAGHHADAVRYTARLLPKPAAVWWGCLCAQQAAPTAADALKPVVAWLRQPSDESRKACRAAAKALGPTRPVGLLAHAAFLSGGNISPADTPAVEPEPHFTGKLVAEAVLAAARGGAKAARLQTYLALAADVYRGANTPGHPAPGERGV